jgi:hypothetical protein
LKELVTDAWRMRAPDLLVGDLDEADYVSSAISTEVLGTPRARQGWRVASPLCEYSVLLRLNGVLRAAGG